jgi:hypothetical protein
MPNTCKSSENRGLALGESGARVSNAWITYLLVEDNLLKGGLILDKFILGSPEMKKAGQLAPNERSASHQLVGGVMAHQGDDG